MACPQPRVDVVVVLDLLATCVRSFPPEHAGRRRGSRLAELVLAELSVTFDDLSVAPIVLEHGVATADATSTPVFTIGAILALRSAHRAELRGSTWERALGAARRDVIRLLDVVPSAVFEAAAAERSTGVARDNVVSGRR